MVKGPGKARFEEIFRQGRRAGGALARVIAVPGTGLIGLSTAKKIGSRPARNRAKRRFREAIRANVGVIGPHLDYIVIVNVDGAGAAYGSIESEIRSLFTRVQERWAGELGFS